jgi:hypothetical protein
VKLNNKNSTKKDEKSETCVVKLVSAHSTIPLTTSAAASSSSASSDNESMSGSSVNFEATSPSPLPIESGSISLSSDKTSYLVHELHLIMTKLKVLCLKFEKRQELLRKIAKLPCKVKPIQRSNTDNNNESVNNIISPLLMNSSISSKDSASSSSSSSFSSLNQNQNQNSKNFFGTIMKKRPSEKKTTLKNIVNHNRKTSIDSTVSSLNNYDFINETNNLETDKIHAKKLCHIINELVETERIYVNELKLVIDGYLSAVNSQHQTIHGQVPNIVLANKDILFGNIEDIYQFHSQIFLKRIDTLSIGCICQLFIECKRYFYLYSMYCLNKPHSEEMWREYCSTNKFFKSIQSSLGLKLPLDSYLLKPIQRISKYQLLLKEMHKHCSSDDRRLVEEALQVMLDVLSNLNDVMHASFIIGCPINFNLKQQGHLLKRDQLFMSKAKRNPHKSAASNANHTSMNNMVSRFKLNSESSKTKQVEVFLFEKTIIICKKKTETDVPSFQAALAQTTAAVNNQTMNSNDKSSTISSNNSSLSSSSSMVPLSLSSNQFDYFYQFREMIKTNEIGLTENFKNDKRKFEIWLNTTSFIFEASNEAEKQSWIYQIKHLLETQLHEIKSRNQSLKIETIPSLSNRNHHHHFESAQKLTKKATSLSTSAINEDKSLCIFTEIAKDNNEIERKCSNQDYNQHQSPTSSSSTSSAYSSTSSSNRTSSFDYDVDFDLEQQLQQMSEQSKNNSISSQTITSEMGSSTKLNKIVNVYNHEKQKQKQKRHNSIISNNTNNKDEKSEGEDERSMNSSNISPISSIGTSILYTNKFNSLASLDKGD